MQVHLLLTPEIREKMPKTTKIVKDFGQLQVVFDNNFENIKTGLHCFIEDTEQNVVNWLKQFDGFIMGNGNPQMEQFQIMHVNEPNK